MLTAEEKQKYEQMVRNICMRYKISLSYVEFNTSHLGINIAASTLKIPQEIAFSNLPPDFIVEITGVSHLYIGLLNTRRGYRLDDPKSEQPIHAS